MMAVLRLGHRPERDKRITTHVCLVARAFGADGVYVVGKIDRPLLAAVERVVENWGGPFWVKFIENPFGLLREWKSAGGKIIHLTMYGLPLSKVLPSLPKSNSILIVIGGEKVPSRYYSESDFNVGIGNQPHSEVAALAICLDRISERAWENKVFENARLVIRPSERGKEIVETGGKKKPF
uniref:tRNA (cytidine(56)-2'-O)-methyltransferase n=1 Tax=Candidatus Methanomethylicus mesodigestus TaxID=1867258 RepID=A0A7C3IXT4_9CREN